MHLYEEYLILSILWEPNKECNQHSYDNYTYNYNNKRYFYHFFLTSMFSFIVCANNCVSDKIFAPSFLVNCSTPKIIKGFLADFKVFENE